MNSVAANCTSITINGKRFSSSATTKVHTSAGLAMLSTVSIQPGSAVRFMLTALSPDGSYLVTPRIAEIWVAE